MPQNTDQNPILEPEDHLVLRKVTGRKRKFDSDELKMHFIKYFSNAQLMNVWLNLKMQ